MKIWTEDYDVYASLDWEFDNESHSMHYKVFAKGRYLVIYDIHFLELAAKCLPFAEFGDDPIFLTSFRPLLGLSDEEDCISISNLATFIKNYGCFGDGLVG